MSSVLIRLSSLPKENETSTATYQHIKVLESKTAYGYEMSVSNLEYAY